ncbi:MAG: hypothetical protein ABIM99_04500 [Candidatus Dojkabacteria bacterium]
MFAKSVLKFFNKYKFIIIGSFLVIITGAVVFFTRVSAVTHPDINVEVKPSLNLSPCFNNQVPPKAAIVAPPEGSRYTTGDKVSLTGVAVLECNNSKLEDSDLAWYLDADTTPFAQGYAFTLENLKAGDHKIKLTATSGKLYTDVFVNIKVEDPKPAVLGIKTPNPVPTPPPAPVNQAPVVTILSPLDGDKFTVDVIPSTQGEVSVLQPITFKFSGTAKDDKDGTIPDNNYTWKIGDSPIGVGSILSYIFTPASTCPKSLDITLEVKDSAGLIGSSKITIILNYTRTAALLCPSSAG